MNGYVYSPGTAAGFKRMQRMGIPRPLFRTEDKLAKVVKKQFKKLVHSLLADIKEAASNAHVTLDRAPLTQDGDLEDLIDFFEKSAQEDEILRKANLEAAANSLEHQWLDNDELSLFEEDPEVKGQILKALQEQQNDYLKRLFEDADPKTQAILTAFSLDKQKLFNDNMEKIRELYLANSIQRLEWEQESIKRAMLRKIINYIQGTSKTLELDSLINYAMSYGDNMARMFARDQMARFNKAVTLSTFKSAGVTKVKWVITHDVRVRDTHKALDGQIFDINNLPEEFDDYNCRCGLVPVEWAE